MTGKILTRLSTSLFAVLGIMILVFFMIHAIPGDPVDNLLGEQASGVDRENMRKNMNLHLPLHRQFTIFVGSILDGSLGKSFVYPGRTVSSMIFEVFPDTFFLAVVSMFLAIIFAVPLGVIAAMYRGKFPDSISMVIAVLGISMPNVWLGPLLVLLFCINLGWLPPPGSSTGISGTILPAITLGSALMAMIARITRSSMINVLKQQYITAARARGLSSLRIIIRHALPNALIPVTTIIFLQFGALLSGAVIVEKIFARPGIGTLVLRAITQRDYPVIQGTVLVIAMMVVSVNIISDILYMIIDPRIGRKQS
ncbi:MAG: ABC transporter permease [Deltaproteobacteria bacterium]|nr:ABC transporter permease [Deltaproteobacteria bacterium]